MVTGASTANLALILVDARNGVVEQTRRHSFIADLLGIKHICASIKWTWLIMMKKLTKRYFVNLVNLQVVRKCLRAYLYSLSALKGDNVVKRSETAWYKGAPTLSLGKCLCRFRCQPCGCTLLSNG